MPPAFHTTQWTQVIQAASKGDQAADALSGLCGAYYAPVVEFLRRDGRTADAAQEAAHAFFSEILTKGIGQPDPARGKFRSYILGALQNFLAKQRVAMAAQKRGGGQILLSLQSTVSDTQAGVIIPAAAELPLEVVFDREWALTMLGRALQTLEAENGDSPEKANTFATLLPWLDGTGAGRAHTEVAASLDMTAAAVKMCVSRLRSRLRELIRHEVAATVFDDKEVAGEIRHLLAALVQNSRN